MTSTRSLGISRRRFLATSAVAAGALAGGRIGAAATPVERADVHFFVIGDTHYLAEKENPTRLDPRSAAVTAALVDTLNRLPGMAIPEISGGGTIAAPRGVIHAGDLIDTGDKTGGRTGDMQRTEWDAYVKDFGLTGNDGRLRVPVYEVHGNHDGPAGRGVAIDGIAARNKTRPSVTNVSPNGMHYSWDWGPVHLVCLGIVVGRDRAVTRRRRYDPLDSLDFLAEDLKAKVGDSGRPVVITHHVDVARYTLPCDPEAPFDNKEWDPCDVRAYHSALRPYNVVAVFYGHTHVRNVFRWDGRARKAAAVAAGPGVYDVFNVDNASHFASDEQALFYVHVADDRLTVREYATEDRWATGHWTPQVWSRPIAVARS